MYGKMGVPAGVGRYVRFATVFIAPPSCSRLALAKLQDTSVPVWGIDIRPSTFGLVSATCEDTR